jgi:hypothetical protein
MIAAAETDKENRRRPAGEVCEEFNVDLEDGDEL